MKPTPATGSRRMARVRRPVDRTMVQTKNRPTAKSHEQDRRHHHRVGRPAGRRIAVGLVVEVLGVLGIGVEALVERPPVRIPGGCSAHGRPTGPLGAGRPISAS